VAWAKTKLKQGVAYVKEKAKQGVAWAKAKVKAVGKWVKGKYEKGKAWLNKKLGRDKDPQTRLEKGVNAGVAAVNKFEGKKVGAATLKPILWGIRSWYKLGVLEPVVDGGYWAVRGEIQRMTQISNVKAHEWREFLKSNKGKYRNPQEASLAYRFRGIRSATFEEVVSRIPSNASKRILTPIPGKVTQGVEYKWTDSRGVSTRVRIHGPDASAPPGSNASAGWVVRIQSSNRMLSHDGSFHHRQSHNQLSPNYNPAAADDTHISIQAPLDISNL